MTQETSVDKHWRTDARVASVILTINLLADCVAVYVPQKQYPPITFIAAATWVLVTIVCLVRK